MRYTNNVASGNLLLIQKKNYKVMISRKGGRLQSNISFSYNDNPVEIVIKFTYLGIILQPVVLSLKLKVHLWTGHKGNI
jgi:hypothetical protein